MDNLNIQKCNTCEINKTLEEFAFRNKQKEIRHKQCKICASQTAKEKNKANPRKSVRRKYSEEEIIIISEKLCIKCNTIKSPDLFHKNYFRIDGLQKQCKNCQKEYNLENRDRFNTNRRKRFSDPCSNERKSAYKRRNQRIANDSNYKIRLRLSRRIFEAVKNNNTKKAFCTLELMGCSPLKLTAYLESKFQLGMSWENYGMHGWHVDHIKPCCSFDLTDPEQQKICFHYTNLQPLWAKDHYVKSVKDKKNSIKLLKLK